MSNFPTMPEALAHDWRALQSLVDHYGQHQRIPCRDGGPRASMLWTSDDARDQEVAAVECRACPALEQCRTYGLAHPKESGVLGGLTEAERKQAARNKEGAHRA